MLQQEQEDTKPFDISTLSKLGQLKYMSKQDIKSNIDPTCIESMRDSLQDGKLTLSAFTSQLNAQITIEKFLSQKDAFGYTLTYYIIQEQQFDLFLELLSHGELQHPLTIAMSMFKALLSMIPKCNTDRVCQFLKRLEEHSQTERLVRVLDAFQANKSLLDIKAYFNLKKYEHFRIYKRISKLFIKHLPNTEVDYRTYQIDLYLKACKIPTKHPLKLTDKMSMINIFHHIIDQSRWDLVGNKDHAEHYFSLNKAGWTPYMKLLLRAPLEIINQFNNDNEALINKYDINRKTNCGLNILHLVAMRKDINQQLISFITNLPLLPKQFQEHYYHQIPLAIYLEKHKHCNTQFIKFLSQHLQTKFDSDELHVRQLYYRQLYKMQRPDRKKPIQDADYLKEAELYYLNNIQLAKVLIKRGCDVQLDWIDWMGYSTYAPFDLAGYNTTLLDLLIRNELYDQAAQVIQSQLKFEVIVISENVIEQINQLKKSDLIEFSLPNCLSLLNLLKLSRTPGEFKDKSHPLRQQLIDIIQQQLQRNVSLIIEPLFGYGNQNVYHSTILNEFCMYEELITTCESQYPQYQLYNVIVNCFYLKQMNQKWLFTLDTFLSTSVLAFRATGEVISFPKIWGSLELEPTFNGKIGKILNIYLKHYCRYLQKSEEGIDFLLEGGPESIDTKMIWDKGSEYSNNFLNKFKSQYGSTHNKKLSLKLNHIGKDQGRDVINWELAGFKVVLPLKVYHKEPTTEHDKLIYKAIKYYHGELLAALICDDKYLEETKALLQQERHLHQVINCCASPKQFNYLGEALCFGAFDTFAYLNNIIRSNLEKAKESKFNWHHIANHLISYGVQYFQGDKISVSTICNGLSLLFQLQQDMQKQLNYSEYDNLKAQLNSSTKVGKLLIKELESRLIFTFFSVNFKKVIKYASSTDKVFEIFNYIEGLERREKDLTSICFLEHNPKVLRKLIESLPNGRTDLVWKYLRIGNGINLKFAKNLIKTIDFKNKKTVLKLRAIFWIYFQQGFTNGLYFLLLELSKHDIQLNDLNIIDTIGQEDFILAAQYHWSLGLNMKQFKEFIAFSTDLDDKEKLKAWYLLADNGFVDKLALVMDWVQDTTIQVNAAKDLLISVYCTQQGEQLQQKAKQRSFEQNFQNTSLAALGQDFVKIKYTGFPGEQVHHRRERLKQLPQYPFDWQCDGFPIKVLKQQDKERYTKFYKAQVQNSINYYTSFYLSQVEGLDKMATYKLIENKLDFQDPLVSQDITFMQLKLLFHPIAIDFDITSMVNNHVENCPFIEVIMRFIANQLFKHNWQKYLGLIEKNIHYLETNAYFNARTCLGISEEWHLQYLQLLKSNGKYDHSLAEQIVKHIPDDKNKLIMRITNRVTSQMLGIRTPIKFYNYNFSNVIDKGDYEHNNHTELQYQIYTNPQSVQIVQFSQANLFVALMSLKVEGIIKMIQTHPNPRQLVLEQSIISLLIRHHTSNAVITIFDTFVKSLEGVPTNFLFYKEDPLLATVILKGMDQVYLKFKALFDEQWYLETTTLCKAKCPFHEYEQDETCNPIHEFAMHNGFFLGPSFENISAFSKNKQFFFNFEKGRYQQIRAYQIYRELLSQFTDQLWLQNMCIIRTQEFEGQGSFFNSVEQIFEFIQPRYQAHKVAFILKYLDQETIQQGDLVIRQGVTLNNSDITRMADAIFKQFGFHHIVFDYVFKHIPKYFINPMVFTTLKFTIQLCVTVDQATLNEFLTSEQSLLTDTERQINQIAKLLVHLRFGTIFAELSQKLIHSSKINETIAILDNYDCKQLRQQFIEFTEEALIKDMNRKDRHKKMKFELDPYQEQQVNTAEVIDAMMEQFIKFNTKEHRLKPNWRVNLDSLMEVVKTLDINQGITSLLQAVLNWETFRSSLLTIVLNIQSEEHIFEQIKQIHLNFELVNEQFDVHKHSTLDNVMAFGGSQYQQREGILMVVMRIGKPGNEITYSEYLDKITSVEDLYSSLYTREQMVSMWFNKVNIDKLMNTISKQFQNTFGKTITLTVHHQALQRILAKLPEIQSIRQQCRQIETYFVDHLAKDLLYTLTEKQFLNAYMFQIQLLTNQGGSIIAKEIYMHNDVSNRLQYEFGFQINREFFYNNMVIGAIYCICKGQKLFIGQLVHSAKSFTVFKNLNQSRPLSLAQIQRGYANYQANRAHYSEIKIDRGKIVGIIHFMKYWPQDTMYQANILNLVTLDRYGNMYQHSLKDLHSQVAQIHEDPAPRVAQSEIGIANLLGFYPDTITYDFIVPGGLNRQFSIKSHIITLELMDDKFSIKPLDSPQLSSQQYFQCFLNNQMKLMPSWFAMPVQLQFESEIDQHYQDVELLFSFEENVALNVQRGLEQIENQLRLMYSLSNSLEYLFGNSLFVISQRVLNQLRLTFEFKVATDIDFMEQDLIKFKDGTTQPFLEISGRDVTFTTFWEDGRWYQPNTKDIYNTLIMAVLKLHFKEQKIDCDINSMIVACLNEIIKKHIPKLSIVISTQSHMEQPYKCDPANNRIEINQNLRDFSIEQMLLDYYDHKAVPHIYISDTISTHTFKAAYQFNEPVNQGQLELTIDSKQYQLESQDQLKFTVNAALNPKTTGKVLLWLTYQQQLISITVVNISEGIFKQFSEQNEPRQLLKEQFHLLIEGINPQMPLLKQLKGRVSIGAEKSKRLKVFVAENTLRLISKTQAILSFTNPTSDIVRFTNLSKHCRYNLNTPSLDHANVVFYSIEQIDILKAQLMEVRVGDTVKPFKEEGVYKSHSFKPQQKQLFQMFYDNNDNFPHLAQMEMGQDEIQQSNVINGLDKNQTQLATRAGVTRKDVFFWLDKGGIPLDQCLTEFVYIHTMFEQLQYVPTPHFQDCTLSLEWTPIQKGIYKLYINQKLLRFRFPVLAAAPYAANCKMEMSQDFSVTPYFEHVPAEITVKDVYGNTFGEIEQSTFKDWKCQFVCRNELVKLITKVESIKPNGIQKCVFFIETDPESVDVDQDKAVDIDIEIDEVIFKTYQIVLRGIGFEKRCQHMYKQIREERKFKRDSLSIDRFNFLQGLLDYSEKHPMTELRIRFEHEPGSDAGGLSREFYQLIGQTLSSEEYKFFSITPCNPNVYFLDRRFRKLADKEKYGTMIGKWLANSIGLKQIIGVAFAQPFWKVLSDQPIEFDDLRHVLDQQSYDNYKFLMTMPPEELLFLELDFTIGMKHKELKEGGANIPVTSENVGEYLQLLAKYIIQDKYSKIYDAIRQGFNEVYPIATVFKWMKCSDIAYLTQGKSQVTADHILSKTKITGNEQLKSMFENYVQQCDEQMLKNMLKFITGSSSIPYQEDKYLIRVSFEKGQSAKKLPISHTCSKAIEIPYYSTFNQLKTKLDLAFTIGMEGFGFA